MKIKNELKEDQGMFYLEEYGDRIAKLYFRLQDGRLVIEHTEVSPLLKGKGVGKQLVDEAVNYARTHHLKVVPLCAFAKGVFQKFPVYDDVL